MTQKQALTHALILAIIAPDDEKTKKATALADQLALGLTEKEVEQCKTDALDSLEKMGL